MKWLLARFYEPSTYVDMAGACLLCCFLTFTSWGHWIWFGYAVLYIIQAIKSGERGE